MIDCKCLIHPFQNDPGTSQRQRVMDELLTGATKIDARSLADLLDYFVQLSRHINYYDKELAVSDWQPFFKNSIPFSIASIIKYRDKDLENNFSFYNSLFEKKPSGTGLQLNVYFIFYHFISKINTWHLTVKGSGLPIENVLEILIKDKLQQPVKSFIAYANAAIKAFEVRRIDFFKLSDNDVWDLELADLYSIDTSYSKGTKSYFKQIINLNDNFKTLIPVFFNAVTILSDEAEKNLEQSMLPLKEELQKKHPPHLGLLFAFLNMFRHLQEDLNGFTQKHLNFFYKDVLQLKPRHTDADKAHIVFEIQKQLKKYLLKKGLLVKDGKDNNKQQILFSLDEDIVVNKTEVAEMRTVFVNNQSIKQEMYIEGVYMAPDARKSDGVDKDFDDDEPKNFPTVGSKLSKYADPETKVIKPYPDARLGFILASPVLLLNEGTRTVTITLACQLDDPCGEAKLSLQKLTDRCCPGSSDTEGEAGSEKLKFIDNNALFDFVQKALTYKYRIISKDIIKEAKKKGISAEIIEKIRNVFLTETCTGGSCCKKHKSYIRETFVKENRWNKFLTNSVSTQFEKDILNEVFKSKKAFKISFSGEKKWIDAEDNYTLSISNLNGNKFTLKIEVVLLPDRPAVTFYNKNALQEDFDTTSPLVKIELNNSIGLKLNKKLRKKLFRERKRESCCLFKSEPSCSAKISFYHFFRNVKVIHKIGNNPAIHTDETKIDVKVCGLKNVIVQNDESVMDVNAPMLAFGARPKIDSNFYIGCEEIFLKKWEDIVVNVDWKDLPNPLPVDFFKNYYNGYQDFFIGTGVIDKEVLDNKFKVQIAILQDGNWINRVPLTDCNSAADPKWMLFQSNASVADIGCAGDKNYTHQFAINNVSDFTPPAFPLPAEKIEFQGLKKFDVNTRHSFIRFALKCQDFQHDRYPFILARQMSAQGKLPDLVVGAVYYGVTIPGPPPVFTTLNISQILQEVIDNYNLSLAAGPPPFDLKENSKKLINEIIDQVRISGNVDTNIWDQLFLIDNPSTLIPGDPTPFPPPPLPLLLNETDSFYYDRLSRILDWLKGLKEKVEKLKDKGVVIPKEPWTPTISSLALDYTATAPIEDIDLIHLYPFQDTYKKEEIELQPALFPAFCDEGSLFLGLQQLVPGDNLNLLFQLPEATADSEAGKEAVEWHYLDSNSWKPLRNGFEVLDDATGNLTSPGIVKFALPQNMTTGNTVMPKELYWIKATIAKNSKAVSETTGIHPHAVRATFTNDEANDKLRLANPLPEGSISKLNEADAHVKSVHQPYESFDGRLPEMEGQYYVRVSELLRHKGRAIQSFDYERMVLEAFPQLFKVKCINHSFALDAHVYSNDFPYAPGYVILAAIPDLNKLKAGQSFEPKVPVSILEKIEAFIRKRTSPFVRFKAANPRYEKINFCLRLQLVKGVDKNYYREKLKQDLREFMAPWAVGEYDKLTFGQCVYRSDIIRFLENRDYVDFISDLRMGKEYETPLATFSKVCPDTPRSIPIAGDIEVCIEGPQCERWDADSNGRLINPCRTEAITVVNYCKNGNDVN